MMGHVKAPWRVIASMSPGSVAVSAGSGNVRGGLPAASESAALCAGMQRCWLLAARARLGCCEDAIHDLKYALWAEAAGLAVEHGWTVRRGVPVLETLSELAREEFLMPACANGLPARIPEIDKAQRMNMTERAWHKTWKARYALLAELPWLWLAEAERYIIRRQQAW